MSFGKSLVSFFTHKLVQIRVIWTLSLIVIAGIVFTLIYSNYLRDDLKSNILLKSQLLRLEEKLQLLQYQLTYIRSRGHSVEGDSLMYHYLRGMKSFSEELEEMLILSNKYETEYFREKYIPKIDSLKKHVLGYRQPGIPEDTIIQAIIRDIDGLYTQISETSTMVSTSQRQVSVVLSLIWVMQITIAIAFCFLLAAFSYLLHRNIVSNKEKKELKDQLTKSSTQLLESQHLAKVGNWDVDLLTGEHSFSEQFFILNEAYTLEDQQPYYQHALQDTRNPFWKRLHSEDMPHIQEAVQKALSTYSDFDLEYRIVNSSGKIRYFRNTAKFIQGAAESPIKLAGTIQDITAYKSLLNKLNTSNYLIQGILESTQEQIFALDVQFNYIAFNQTHAAFMKMSVLRDIEVGECMLDYILYPEIQRYLETNIRAVLAGNIIKNEYKRIRNVAAEGQYIHTRYSSYPIYNQQGKVRGVAVFVSNITQQVNAEAEKKQQEEKYIRLVENMTESVVYFDENAKIVFANPSFYELTQISGSPALFDDFSQIFSQQTDQELFDKLVIKTLAGDRVHLEASINRNLNQPAWVKLVSVPMRSTSSGLSGFMITITDLTKHKNLEDALSKSEQRLRYILDNTQTMIIIHDLHGCILETNKILFENFFYTPESFIGKNISEFIPTYNQQYLDQYLQEVVTQRIYTGNMTVLDRHGNKRILAYKNICIEADPPYVIASAVEVTQEFHARREVERQKALIQQIISISPNLIFVKNQQLEYVLVNQAFANFFHKKVADIIGITDKSLISESGLITLYEAMDAECVKKPYKLYTYEHSIFHDGEEKRFFFTKMSFWSNNDQLILGISTDITQQYQYQKEVEEVNDTLKASNTELNSTLDKLQETNEKLSQMMRVKDEFLANMSHEIRTPLNAIIGFAELIQKSELSEKQLQYIQIVHQASEKLLQIINDLLDFNKLESGKITLYPVEFAPKDDVKFLQDLFEFRFKEKGLSLNVVYSSDIPEILIGDINRLHQILINLIGNACKFTLQGFVMLSVGVEAQTADSCRLFFEITDTGIGIPEDKLAKIFERFEQVSSGLSRKFEGTGLGLSITRSLVTLMGGTITVSSTLGQGSTFRVVAPFQIPTKRIVLAKTPEEPAEIPAQSLNVLLVEDNVMNQLLAKKVLETLNHTVVVAENGAVAIQQLQENQYDIVLLDIQMPVLDGYQTIQKIRQELNLSIPVIALTAHSSIEEKEKCLAIGFNSYISKPFKNKHLQEQLLFWVKNAHT